MSGFVLLFITFLKLQVFELTETNSGLQGRKHTCNIILPLTNEKFHTQVIKVTHAHVNKLRV